MKLLVIDAELAKAVAAHSKKWAPKETGGIVVGYRCDSAIHVTGFIGPGPDAKHARASFVRDGEFAQRSLEDVVQRTGGSSDYLGEWHSHPAPVEPSGRDEKSIRWVASNDAYDCGDPILIVATRDGSGWSLRAFAFNDTVLKRCDVVDTCDACGRTSQDGVTVRPNDT